MNKTLISQIEKINKMIERNEKLGYVNHKFDMQCMAEIICIADKLFKLAYRMESEIYREDEERAEMVRTGIYDETFGCFYEVSGFEDDFWQGTKYGDYSSGFYTLVGIVKRLESLY